jgi:hypothetical protein
VSEEMEAVLGWIISAERRSCCARRAWPIRQV